MNRIIGVLLLLTGQLAGYYSFSQQPVYKHYTVSDGLPHSTIFRLHQQPNGLLWIGTDHGLCSFDGKNFHTYLPDSSMEYTSILAIIDYTADSLLFYVYKKGYYLLHRKGISLLHAEVEELRDVIFMKRDRIGRIWLYNTKGECGYFYRQRYYAFQMPKTELLVRYMEVTPHAVYFGTNLGLYRLDHGSKKAVIDTVLGEVLVTGITWSPDQKLWLGTRQITYELQFDGRQMVNKTTVDFVPVSKIIEDANGNKWIQETHKGVWLQRKTTEREEPLELISNVVNDMLIDHEGNTWVGTYGKGLYCYSSPGTFKQIEVFQPRVMHLADSGDVLVGAMGQLLVVKKGDLHDLRKIPLAKGRIVTHIFQTNPHEWVISTTHDFFRYNGSAVSRMNITDIGINASAVNPASPGQVLMGINGLQVFGDTIVPYLKEDVFSQKVYAMQFDHHGDLWVGTDKSLLKMRGDSIWEMKVLNTQGSFRVYDLIIDSNRIIWVATSRGLIRCEKEDCRMVPLNSGQLQVIPCKALTIDHNNRIWVATPLGVFRKEGEKFRILEIPFNESLEDIYDLLIDKSGELWLATTNRLISMNVNYIHTDPDPLKVHFGSILLGKAILDPKVSEEVRFDRDFHNLEINYSVIAFSKADQVICEYKLFGHDPGWQQTTDRRIVYHALEPGTYRLALRAKFKNQEQFSPPQTFSFTLLPPFYRTYWFRGSIALLVMGVIFMVLYTRQRRIRKKKEEQLLVNRRLSELRHSAVNAMMNPHFVNNTLSSIQQFVKTKDKQASARYISRFSKLIRSSLETAFHNKVSLYNELERLNLFLDLEKARLEDQFDYLLEVPEELDTEIIEIPNLVIQPFVENAIWHGILPGGTPGTVTITISQISDEMLKIVIEDDGVGIYHSNDDYNHHSLGMELVEEKLKLNHHDNDLYIEEIHQNELVKGTRVTLLIHIGTGQ